MTANARLFLAGGALALLVAWSVAVGTGTAADDKDVRKGVQDVADMIASANGGAKEQAQKIGKDAELEEVMALFKLRSKKGFGIGKPGLVKANEDGIEAKLMGLGKRALSAKDVGAQADALAEAGYRAAAIAAVAEDKCPVDKKQGDKDPAKWKEWSKGMHDAALDLAKEAKAKNAAGIKTAANKLNASCNDCHAVFRD